jgi:hypothetical protein
LGAPAGASPRGHARRYSGRFYLRGVRGDGHRQEVQDYLSELRVYEGLFGSVTYEWCDNKMIVLDMETDESAYESLKTILTVSRDELNRFFDKVRVSDFTENPPRAARTFGEYLLKGIEKIKGKSKAIDRTCFFHFTRVSQEESFKDGLLPLGIIVERIWQGLRALVKTNCPEAEWKRFRKEFNQSQHHSAYLYRLKVNDATQWGPYAFLIRNTDHRENGERNHNYLRTPEIVEDICTVYREIFGFDLLSAYMQSTVPCVVKFYLDEKIDRVLSVALSHLHNRFKNLGCFDECEYSHNTNGELIPFNRISKIESL